MGDPASAAEARELVRKITRLLAQVQGRAPGDLSRWLESLRRRLDGHILA